MIIFVSFYKEWFWLKNFNTPIIKQKLDNIEVAELAPAGKGDEVEEFADADARFAVQTKEGDGYAALECWNITVTHGLNIINEQLIMNDG
mgnify:CR=1 FL=1